MARAAGLGWGGDRFASVPSAAQFSACVSCSRFFYCFVDMSRSCGPAFRLAAGWCPPWGRAGSQAVICPISSWQLPARFFTWTGSVLTSPDPL